VPVSVAGYKSGMPEDTLPPDAPDPETIAAAEEEPDPLLKHPPRTSKASDPMDPIGRREDATERGTEATLGPRTERTEP
jgi:hypothetical protein